MQVLFPTILNKTRRWNGEDADLRAAGFSGADCVHHHFYLLIMDSKPPTGKRMKPRAPPPPLVPQPAPRRIFRGADSQDEASVRDMKENMLSESVELRLTLPTGFQTTVTEDGSKALMDVLVELCSRYHLNPSLHTLELFTPEGHPLGFKPNALLGSLMLPVSSSRRKCWRRDKCADLPPKCLKKQCVSLIVLLKDSISRQQLPLDKSLSHLGIKELYVLDKSLDSLRSSTNSLARAEKKGLLGMFQFSRRKSKTETTSLDMEDYNDTESQSNTMFGPAYLEKQTQLSQSQSAMNISRTSPKAEAKKRRAPAPPGVPTHSTEHLSYQANQMNLGLETQQRKRKAPAPPQHQCLSLVAPKTSLPLQHLSSTPSSTTSDSLVVQDSSSELSQSLEESDAASHCSTTTGSMVSGPTKAQTMTKSSISKTEESESTTNVSISDVTTASSSRPDAQSAINLKMEETENNRHSGVAWLHSMQTSAAKAQCKEISPEETVSLGSNSSGISLPDQGYAASESMADGEDSGLVSSPSETTTSPDGSLSLDGSTGGEKRMGTATDNFSDSDEGSWGSRHRCSDVSPHPRTDRLKHQDLSAQLHQTLAELESCLADSNEVPISIVDHDVPVTTIDEVLPDEGFWADSIVTNASSHTELQNRNNNAHTTTETNKTNSTESKQLSQHKSVQQPIKTDKKDTTSVQKTNEIKKTEPFVQNKSSSKAKSYYKEPDSNERDIKPEESQIHQAALTTVNRETVDLPKVHHTVSISKPLQSKITHSVTSRFGMKTFTVIPPKPAILHAAAGEPASTTPGAIKIDEQGNMVKTFHHRTSGVSDLRNGHDDPFHEKAKVFWSSNEKQEGDVGPNKGQADKTRDSLNSHISAWTKPTEATKKTTETGNSKASQRTHYTSMQLEAVEAKTEEVKDIENKQNDHTLAKDECSPTTNSSQRPAQPPFINDVRRDLSFLKPSRRTSSQYVASAITKHAPRTSIKPDYNPTTQEFPLKTQHIDHQKSSRSIQINPQHSFHSSSTSSSTSNSPGSKRSTSYPEHISERQEDGVHEVKETGISETNGFGKGGLQKTPKNVSSTQLNVKVNDSFKSFQRQSHSPSPSRGQYLSDKPPTRLKNGHQEQALMNTVPTSSSVVPKTDETPSVSVKDTPEAPAVTVFGPVKKFKPVICKSVEKETSLHSSLMEAIQSGGGKERLKKISARGSNLKKPSYVEEENERSALMAAIRAQGNSGRLRKTKSEAAGELENFRKTVLDMNSTAQNSSMPSSPLSSAPLTPTVAPPPPPPVLPALKPFTQSQPCMNPAMAREAMLEAIRSGSAAEKLKKVAVPAKTVQVNGKLGTMKATPSTVS
ncbi:hypothetical protein WMY93_026806 [Mugilogobius chulae]|uniref:WH2 domain-containing protein n=1 Tax=Mugilogobius chulae TaxID=88201 RepID=A0AAW0N472_9GOBI